MLRVASQTWVAITYENLFGINMHAMVRYNRPSKFVLSVRTPLCVLHSADRFSLIRVAQFFRFFSLSCDYMTEKHFYDKITVVGFKVTVY